VTEIVTRDEAIARGLKRYFSGFACVKGHTCERYLSGGCTQCLYESNKRRKEEHPDEVREWNRKYQHDKRRYLTRERKKRRDKNIDHERALARERRRKSPEQHRTWNLKYKYGITADEFNEMVLAQGGKCAICITREPGRYKTWAIDHCHTTGAVRGLLCDQCNILLGNAKDNPSTLRAAADYLERTTSMKEAA